MKTNKPPLTKKALGAFLKKVNVGLTKAEAPVMTTLDDPSAACHITEWLPTGSAMLDSAISGLITGGGLPVGATVEIAGKNSTGKSAVGAKLIANAQERGWLTVLFDTEVRAILPFYVKMGMDPALVAYQPCNTIEDLFFSLGSIISSREKDSDILSRPMLVVWDSLASSRTSSEKDHVEKGEWRKIHQERANAISTYLSVLAHKFSDANVTFVILNHIKIKGKVGFGKFERPIWDSVGGDSVKFHASVRIRMAIVEDLKPFESKMVHGRIHRARIVKSSVGPQNREAFFGIFEDRGIDDEYAWMGVLHTAKLISLTGNGYVKVVVSAAAAEQLGKKAKAPTEVTVKKGDFVTLCKEDGPFRFEIIRLLAESIEVFPEESAPLPPPPPPKKKKEA